MRSRFLNSLVLSLLLLGVSLWTAVVWKRVFQMEASLRSRSEHQTARAGNDFGSVRSGGFDGLGSTGPNDSERDEAARTEPGAHSNQESLEEHLDRIFAPFLKGREGTRMIDAESEIRRTERADEKLAKLETFAHGLKSLSADDLQEALAVLAEREISGTDRWELYSLIFMRTLVVDPERRVKKSVLYGLDLWAVRSWLRQDFDKALAWLESIKGTRKEAYRNGLVQVVRVLAATDFKKALRFAESARAIDVEDLNSKEHRQGRWVKGGVPPDQRLDPVLVLAGCRISAENQQVIIDYALKLPAKRRDGILNALGKSILFRDGFASAQELYERQKWPGKLNALLLSIACSSIETSAPEKASWLLEVSPREFQARNLRFLVHTWLERDVIGISAWLESLPSGSQRDEAIFVFAENVAKINREIALEWGNLIENSALRKELETTMQSQITPQEE